MEGSSGFQGSMQASYHLLNQHLDEPVSQHQQFQDEHLSKILTSEKLEEWTKVLEKEIDGHHLIWTDEMARLLITAISYLSEAALLSEPDANAISKKLLLMPKMQKWKIISMAMGERGYNVTPHQCEVKFNDINGRYKRLIGILGLPASCKIVENPGLLDCVDIGERQKEVVRELLASEQFLYPELCSLYHNNRLFLPHDWELRRSVMLNLVNYCGEERKDEGLTQCEKSTKRRNVSDELRARWLRLEEEKVKLQKRKVELEKARLEWLESNKNEDVRLQEMRLENENLRLQNARLAFELKRGTSE